MGFFVLRKKMYSLTQTGKSPFQIPFPHLMRLSPTRSKPARHLTCPTKKLDSPLEGDEDSMKPFPILGGEHDDDDDTRPKIIHIQGNVFTS